MRIALFDDYRIGLVTGESIVDLSGALPAIMDLPGLERMNALISGFSHYREILASAADGPRRPLADVTLRAPTPRPRKMLFAQGNYFEGVESPVLPLSMFLKAPSAVLDPGGIVRLTRDDAVVFQHEAELGVVIGKPGRNIDPAVALDHVFGYCCVIDVSARGIGRGLDFADKSPDTFCPLGPWIATRDEVPDPQSLAIRLTVNGRPRQDYNTDDMEHPVSELVAWASRIMTLEVGDVIACGTNHGGLGPIQDGDELRISIENIGEMPISVVDPLKRRWPDGIDPAVQAAVIKMRTTGTIPPPAEMFALRRMNETRSA